MKKSIALLLTCVAFSATSQINVFSGGTQSYGSSFAPIYGERHHFTGDLIVSEAGNTAGSCVLLRANGTVTNTPSASRPDYTWLGDNGTGFFQAAYNNIGFSIGGTERMRLSGGGNLLLGTASEYNSRFVTSIANNCAIVAIATHTADNAYCQINYVNRNLTKAYSVYNTASGSSETFYVKGSGDVWAKSTTHWSDRNLKENIDTLQNSLSKLKQLKGVKYNFKSSNAGTEPLTKELGLIAQDVELVFPEVVNTNDKGIKGIMYHGLIPVLIEAIKELDKKNIQLEKRLNNCCSKSSESINDRKMSFTDNIGAANEDIKSYMKQNRPNPFNKETVIEYNIVESGTASILVFDMNGKLLKTISVKIPGKGSVTINANDFNPGMYYYSLIVNDDEVDTKKMILTQ